MTRRPVHPSRILLTAAIVDGAGILGEGIIGTVTLISGFQMGWFDVAGAGLGILALAVVWRWPLAAAALWLATVPFIYNGGLLVSVACLPLLLVPPTAAGLALWSWRQSRRNDPTNQI